MSTSAVNATAPHDAIMANSACTTPVKSPSRRVLGDLTSKAINTPPTVNNVGDSLKSHSPLKQVHTLSPHASLDVENFPQLPVSKIGRKRSIYEVDGAVASEDVREDAPKSFGPREAFQMDAMRSVATPTRHDIMTPNMDDHENAEQTSPIEANTPEADAPVSQETSASKASFSSLIDYNPHGSSQILDRVSSPAPEVAAEKREPISKSTVKSQAETLRLRLRVALYKVRTNQTSTPLCELTLPYDQQPTPSLTTSATTAATSSMIPSILVSPVRRDSATKPTSNLNLLPAPILLPTAYSSRMITEESYLPSSPPTADCSPIRRTTAPNYTTPVARRMYEQSMARRERIEEEDSDGDIEIDSLQNKREHRFDEGDLTSSVVKGRAASGLLALGRAS